ncbi:MAG: hypothetical protein J0L92_00450 [Deltaproteobacteria bacterium]|nr:hypothetical protein [Deltaproteobacteria bacterium]
MRPSLALLIASTNASTLLATGCACEENRARIDAGRGSDASPVDTGVTIDANVEGVDVYLTRIDAYADDAPPDAAAMTCGGTTAPLPYPSETPGSMRTEPASCSECAAFVDVGASATGTTARITGTTSNVAIECRWYLESSGCGSTSGSFLPDEFGTFGITLPLFCGTNTLQLVCESAAGRSIATREITGPACDGRDVQVTLAWGATAYDMELHLVRDGFHINDATNDCTWFTCMSISPDWGTLGDATDDPRKDVDNTTTYGPENIYLTRAPAGRYHVMVEYWGSGTADTSEVSITLGGATVWRGERAMNVHEVWSVGTLDFPGGSFTPVDTLTPCESAWRTGGSYGCALPIP